MATDNLIDNAGSDYNTFEPPPYIGQDENVPRSDQYQPAPPSCKLQHLVSDVLLKELIRPLFVEC